MKRFLLALSAAAICTGAHAQSGVRLSGSVDLMLTHGTGSIGDRSGVGSGGNATSKLIFRASEDLGGGLSAHFWLEAGLAADSGAGQASSANNQPSGQGSLPTGGVAQGLTFNRRSDLWLVAPWGEVHFGRLQTPTYEIYSGRFDPFALGVGIGVNYSVGLNSGFVRLSNDLAYYTPTFYGVSANLHTWFGENASGAVTSDDGSGNGILIKYDSGPLSAVAGWARTSYVAGDVLTRSVGASYAFNAVKLVASLNRDRQGSVDQHGFLVGAWMPFGPHEIKASYSGKRILSGTDPKTTKLAVGYVYSFSKRTAVYATLAHAKNSGGASHALNGAVTGPNQSSNGLDIGLRNHF